MLFGNDQPPHARYTGFREKSIIQYIWILDAGSSGGCRVKKDCGELGWTLTKFPSSGGAA
jgi:hypothetical protein